MTFIAWFMKSITNYPLNLTQRTVDAQGVGCEASKTDSS